MAGDLIIATESDREIARHGILMHLQATGINKNHDSFADAMSDLDMWEFTDNMVEVVAQLRAEVRKLDNIIRESLNSGSI